MKKVIVVVGPTSVGKTRMGVELAKELKGEVISGDSMQIYRGMDIGTAKVTAKEAEGIPHHLIDICDIEESYSVKRFQDDVRNKINDITARGKIPIIVGGTGFYIKAALYDYVFEEEQANTNMAKYQDMSNDELYEVLLSIDPESCKTIHKNNRKRVLRAIAIYENNNTTKSAIENAQQHKPIYDIYFIALTLERELLYNRINNRVDLMMQQGLEAEVDLLTQHGSLQGLRCFEGIGYKEFFDYFKGVQTLSETVELIKKNSRNFAKRQYTWFNNQFDVSWYEVNLEKFTETVSKVLIDVENWYHSK